MNCTSNNERTNATALMIEGRQAGQGRAEQSKEKREPEVLDRTKTRGIQTLVIGARCVLYH